MRKLTRKEKVGIGAVCGLVAVGILAVLPVFYQTPDGYTLSRKNEYRENDLAVADSVFTENSKRRIVVGESEKKYSLFQVLAGAEEKKKSTETEVKSETEAGESIEVVEETDEMDELEKSLDLKNDHDEKYANQFLTKERGSSDEFYKNEEEKAIYIDYGAGLTNLSDCVEYWMYGEPVVNLNKMAEAMGLTLSLDKPDDFLNITRSESYWPGDEPKMETRYNYDLYLLGPNEQAILYQMGSTMQIDSDHYYYKGVFQVEGDREDGYKTLVSISQVPYFDGTTMKAGVPQSYQYQPDRINIVFGTPDQSTGVLAMENIEYE